MVKNKNNTGCEAQEAKKNKHISKDATADDSVLGHSYYGQAYEDSLMKDNSYEPADTELEPKTGDHS